MFNLDMQHACFIIPYKLNKHDKFLEANLKGGKGYIFVVGPNGTLPCYTTGRR